MADPSVTVDQAAHLLGQTAGGAVVLFCGRSAGAPVVLPTAQALPPFRGDADVRVRLSVPGSQKHCLSLPGRSITDCVLGAGIRPPKQTAVAPARRPVGCRGI